MIIKYKCKFDFYFPLEVIYHKRTQKAVDT
nr:MAG TPA: hypothetical protein [Caudoviricetes sp.]